MFYIWHMIKKKNDFWLPCTTSMKSPNCEILSKNLVAFKKWYGIKDEKFEYVGVHWKI